VLDGKGNIMKVMIVCGSRSAAGQTGRATAAIEAGLRDAGAECETAMLPTMKIERCRQCDDAGWGLCLSEGCCVIEDDLAELAGKLRAADGVVFTTPVYFGDLSESLRAFLDRLRRTCVNEAGKEGIKGTPAVGVCVAGSSGGGAATCAVSLKQALTTTGFDVVDVVPARRQNLETKIEVLRTVGKWFAGCPRS